MGIFQTYGDILKVLRTFQKDVGHFRSMEDISIVSRTFRTYGDISNVWRRLQNHRGHFKSMGDISIVWSTFQKYEGYFQSMVDISIWIKPARSRNIFVYGWASTFEIEFLW